ncbi:hypothetical protein BX070DRAFT_249993 [Coemansia spiralis]|nr:hypothetical protein BX070DRAFT_249993 [Coemansia spiralis]
MDPGKHCDYVVAQVEASDVLSNFHENKTTLQTTSKQQIYRKDRCTTPGKNKLIRGVGMRWMLRKHELSSYLIDEYKSLSLCPWCLENVATAPNFKYIGKDVREDRKIPERFSREKPIQATDQ